MDKPSLEQMAALNVRIAELCGWTNCDRAPFGCDPDGMYDRQLPRFTGSLDAIHEAETTLMDGDTWSDYLDTHLPAVVEDENAVECAEAWQRAIALDRALSEKPIL